MEKPTFQPIGTPVMELDTPALVLDIEALHFNLEQMSSVIGHSDVVIRSHVSTFGCPAIAHLYADRFSGNRGIAVSTIGECEVFANSGFSDILITNQIITRPKIFRLCSIAANHSVQVLVDNPENVRNLSDLAVNRGVTIGCKIEIDVGLGRGGLSYPSEITELANLILELDNVELRGMTANFLPLHVSSVSTKSNMETLVRVFIDSIRQMTNINPEDRFLSVRSNEGFQDILNAPEISEIQIDTVPLMDHKSLQTNPQFKPSVKVLCSVLSRPIPSRVVVDAGHKTTGPDIGLPVVDGLNGIEAVKFSAEHGALEVSDNATHTLYPNDKVWLIPFDLSLCTNQFDYFRVVRNNVLDGLWPISSRGSFG
tara:strand:- start:10360 stop:11466 length:1107 start_codon:yes stop_codon:yes gene_type:complete